MLLIGAELLRIGKQSLHDKAWARRKHCRNNSQKNIKQLNGVKQDAFFMWKIIILQNGITQTVNQPPETAVFCYTEKNNKNKILNG